MFGYKAGKIKDLEEELIYVRAKRDEYWKEYANTSESLAGKESELAILQEAYSGRSRELDQALESITGYENQVQSLDEELARFHDINVALADENRDLKQRLDLLQDVLKQLQIPVKLPRKK